MLQRGMRVVARTRTECSNDAPDDGVCKKAGHVRGPPSGAAKCRLAHAVVRVPDFHAALRARCGPDAPWQSTLWTHESYLEFLKPSGMPVPLLLVLAVPAAVEGCRCV